MLESLKLLKVLCVTELPAAIEICNILTPPVYIDYYLYKITHIRTGKYYWGKHKWDGIVYWHSGKCEELNYLWSTENNAFKYEVIAYGDEDKISKLEDAYINEAFSKKCPLIWNKQRGIVRKKDLQKDIQIVNYVYNNTINGKYKKTTLSKEDVVDITFKQCRETKVFTDKVLEIADRISNNNGNTTNCDPLIILKDRLGPGKHLGINGYHTKCGFIKAKNSTQIDVIFIPKEDHKNIPDSLLIRLGNSFNKKSTFVQTPIEKADLLKELMEEFETGYKHSDDEIRYRAIAELNFSSRQAGGILRAFHKMKKNANLIKSRKKSFNKLSTNDTNKLSKDRKSKYPNKTIWVSASSTLTLDRIYEVLEKQNSQEAHILIHHGSPLDEENWFNYKHDKFVRLHAFSKSPLKIEYESISGWSDTDIIV